MLSSQNPSYLSPIRKFTLTDGTQLGFYETKLSKNKTFSELQTIILNNLNKIQGSTKTNINDLLHSLIINFDTYSQSISIKNIITYFRYFTEIFDKMINITTNITGSVLHPLNSPNSSDNITNDLENIKKALYYNIYVCLYNINWGNPVLSDLDDYHNECITYANHLHFNHFDVCNFLKGDNPVDNIKPYYCDMFEDPTDFDSRRMTQYNNSFDFTT